MFVKLLLALISFKGLKKMEEKFDKHANSTGNPKDGKKFGIGWKIILMLILAVLVLAVEYLFT